MATTAIAPAQEGQDPATILTLTKQHREGQALQQYAYDPAVIDKAVMLGDMKQMDAATRLAFYRAVCLSVGLNPLTQPFTPMERQDKTVWLYANSSCTQQLAAMHQVSFRDIERQHTAILGEPFYLVKVTAYTPDGRAVPSQSVVSLTKKKKVARGTWPNGDPKWVDALDGDGEPILIPLRGEGLANAIMKADTKAFRRATLALVGLGWMQSDAEGRGVPLNLQTGELADDPRLLPTTRLLDTPTEQAKTLPEHIADLSGDPPPDPDALLDPPTPQQVAPGRAGARGGASLRRRIDELHTIAGRDFAWIARYWAKMCGRFGVDAPEHLPLSTLQALLQEVRQFYTKQTPSAVQAARSAPSATPEQSPPVDGLKNDAEGSQAGLPEPASGADWRAQLTALLPQLQDAGLAREAQDLVQDPDATAEAGLAMLGRVQWGVEGQTDGEAP